MYRGWQGISWYRGSVQGLTGGVQVDDRENFGDDRKREGIFIRTGGLEPVMKTYVSYPLWMLCITFVHTIQISYK